MIITIKIVLCVFSGICSSPDHVSDDTIARSGYMNELRTGLVLRSLHPHTLGGVGQ